jgi:hypothetical protein
MISKATHPCTALVAALLYATTASSQENRGTPEQRAAGAPDASGSAAAPFLTPQWSKAA